LKDDLANNYILGMDQYLDTFDKASRLLANYQSTMMAFPYRGSISDTAVVFLQRGGQGGRCGRGAGQAARVAKNEAHVSSESGGDEVSMITWMHRGRREQD
jgi:hypothetical protein